MIMELKEIKLTERRIALLNKMDIHTVEDLLTTYPYRYENITAVPYENWNPSDTVAFEGMICSAAHVVRLGNKRSMTKFKVISWNEELEITLFNRPWPKQFSAGKNITIFGTYNGNNKVLANNYNFNPLKSQEGLRPVYSVTEGLKQNDMRTCIEKALPYAKLSDNVIPSRYVEKYRLMIHSDAICKIHEPKDEKELKAAIRTLKYEEFLRFQCVMQAVQQTSYNTAVKTPKVFDDTRIHEWLDSFKYELTPDQNSAIEEILKDMHSDKIMFRLVQGDVGCGKTVVAMAALYACRLSGMQAALLAPTEILARQHYHNLIEQGMDAVLYVSALSAKEKQEILDGMASDEISIVVGTHALFQEKVQFANLGLVVADEQQRFGVRQRRALLEKGKNVDFLMMSATPIPRTYAHFLFGDMSISNIKTMPPGREPVWTKYVPGSSMGPILADVLKGIDEGRQCYVVCPAIEDNDQTNIRSVTSIYEGMKKTFKDKVSVGLLHGKMTSDQKEAIMEKFANHEFDILVSTTVVEVGIDVPNATMMVIYDAHRFGLSTIHQLRGRAARGKVQGKCWLLSPSKEEDAIKRLKMLEELKDGFSITEYDLQLRGPGDILGVRQSGLPGFVLGDFAKDQAMMEVCIQDAREILELQQDTEILAYTKNAVEKAQYFD